MKLKFLIPALLFLTTASFAQNGNVGIGNTTPGTKLDVSGGITNRETSVAVASNAATITANISQVQLTGTATATIAVTAAAAPNAGQRLVIFNNTTGGFDATLNGFVIPNLQAIEFAFSNGAWQAFKFDVAKPQMIVVEKTASSNMTRVSAGNATNIDNDALKANTIPGASYNSVTNNVSVPAGTYLVQLIIEGDYSPGANNNSTTTDGDKPNHSFFYDFATGASGSKRIHGNSLGNFGGASNFGITIQYITTISSTRNFPFNLGWGQGGNVNASKVYNISTGTQLAITKIL